MPQAASRSARARKSRRSTSEPPARRLRMVSSARGRTDCPATAGSASNLANAVSSMSMLTKVVGRKLPRSTRTAFLRSASLGCSTARSGPNMATPLSPELHQLQGHEPVVHTAELDPAKLDHVDLDPAGGQSVQQALDQRFGLVVEEERAVEQVDADDADRLLLQRCLDVEHPDVQDDLAGVVPGMGLELEPHPPVALVVALEAAGHDGVGEGEERGRVAPLVAESLEVQLVFVVEHRLQATGRDVSVDFAVDGVAHGHVVGGYGLGDRSRGPADPEEPPGHLLSRPDLGHGAVPPGDRG